MAATQPSVSRTSKAASAYRHRFGERRQFHHLFIPGGELGMARPPRLVGVAEVEVAQRAADGDLADRVEVAERGRLLLELDDCARHLALLERNVVLATLVLREGELSPAGLRRIEDAVGQRLLGQRLPARRTRHREEFWRRTDRIEVFADHRAVEEASAVVSNERGHLGESVVLQELRIGGTDLHPLDLLVDAPLDGAGRDLAHIRAGGRIGEFHRYLPPRTVVWGVMLAARSGRRLPWWTTTLVHEPPHQSALFAKPKRSSISLLPKRGAPPRRRPRLAAQDGAGTHGSLDPGHDGRHYGHLFPSQDDAEVLAAGERAPMGAC